MSLKRAKERSRDRFVFLISAGLLMVLCPECGKKGSPVAPKAVSPPSIEDLQAEVMDNRVRLTWSVPKEGDRVFDGLTHFAVYKYESHSSVEMCPGCPIRFEHLFDIKLDAPEPSWVEEDRMICHDIVETGYRYAYKVVAHHKSGGMSDDSNIVQFVVTPNK